MYEIGAGLAFLIWIWSLIILFISLNSQLERNFNKVGYRLSWLTLQPKPMGNNYRKRSFLGKFGKFLLIALSGFISLWFSWLYVAMQLGMFIYSRSKDAGAPQAVKEFRWRMRNMELTFDEVVQGIALVAGNKTSVEELQRQFWSDMVERGNA